MGIEIRIRAGADTATSNVDAFGSVQHIITDKERKTFGIEDQSLKNAVGEYFKKIPTDVFVKSPTPWDDLYKKYKWDEVSTVLVVESATVREITSEPVIVATKTFTNNSSVKATFNASISDQVSNTTESTWNITNTIEVGRTMNYEVSFMGVGGGGELSMSYSRQWGEGGSQSKSVTVGSASGISVELRPNESVESELTASRGVMKVRIVYKAYLIGSTAVNYYPKYKDHHFWCFDIGTVMAAAGIPNYQEFTEDISIGYYSNSRIQLKDEKGHLKDVLSTTDKAAH